MIESTFCSSFGTGRLVMLFYRYMLPYFTTEAYSWADPAEAFFGFKTGVENGLSSWKRSSLDEGNSCDRTLISLNKI